MPLHALLHRASLLAAPLALLCALSPLYARAGDAVHVVGKGQTLGRIAKRYHVTVEALRDANGLKRGQQIHPGLSLTIPDGSEKRAGGEPKGKSSGKQSKKSEEERPEEALARVPKRPGFVRMMRGSEKLEVQLLTRRGRLNPAALPGLSRILRYYPTNEKIPIDPRLATLVGLVSDHFGGRTIHVVSGYRPYSPVQYTPHSNHNAGRAMDFSIEGVPSTTVRDFCRTFRNAGVGYYPNSTFIHLDARAGKTFWIDYSRSGEAPRYDSPGGSAAADESAGEVEPHGGVEGVPATGDGDTGSMKTQDGGLQPTDKKGGNQDTPDPKPAGSAAPGP